MKNSLLKELKKKFTILNSEEGQAITEYAIMCAMFIGVVLTMTLLLNAFARYGSRILALVGMDYP